MGKEVAQNQDGYRGGSKPRWIQRLLKTKIDTEMLKTKISKEVAQNQDGCRG